ncbi:hypothetical protein [Streptomyces sp. NBC_00554]|uniref:SbtR family transcriptional regulator n=1 Tax=Streptomyces sp. NBC_00554 TaxID=2903661 RepID=UPI00352E967C
MSEVPHSPADDGLAGEIYEAVIGAVTMLLRAGEQDGSIRPGVDPDDVLLMLGFLWRTGPGEEGEARVARLLDLVIDGLRLGAPGTPVVDPEGAES